MHAACLAYKRPEWYAAAGFSSQIVGGEGRTPQWAAPESMEGREGKGKRKSHSETKNLILTMMMMCPCSIDNMTSIDAIHESLLEERKEGQANTGKAMRCHERENSRGESSDSLMAEEH